MVGVEARLRGLWRNAGNRADEIDEIEKILLAELKHRDAMDTRRAEVEAFATADDAAAASAGICTRNFAGKPATEGRVRSLDDAIVARELQAGEKFPGLGGNFAVRESAGNGVVKRLERVGNREDVGDCRTAEQRGVRGMENEDIDFIAARREFGKKRSRLNNVAEAPELYNQRARHTGIPSAAPRKSVAGPSFLAQVSPKLRFGGVYPPPFSKSVEVVENESVTKGLKTRVCKLLKIGRLLA